MHVGCIIARVPSGQVGSCACRSRRRFRCRRLIQALLSSPLLRSGSLSGGRSLFSSLALSRLALLRLGEVVRVIVCCVFSRSALFLRSLPRVPVTQLSPHLHVHFIFISFSSSSSPHLCRDLNCPIMSHPAAERCACV